MHQSPVETLSNRYYTSLLGDVAQYHCPVGGVSAIPVTFQRAAKGGAECTAVANSERAPKIR